MRRDTAGGCLKRTADSGYFFAEQLHAGLNGHAGLTMRFSKKLRLHRELVENG